MLSSIALNVQFWAHTKASKNAQNFSHTYSPAEPWNKLRFCVKIYRFILVSNACYLSLVQGQKSVPRQSPRKENKQNLEILATVKHIIEHHRKMIAAKTVKVKLYSAQFSSAKSHHAEKHPLAEPHADSWGTSQMRKSQLEAVELSSRADNKALSYRFSF